MSWNDPGILLAIYGSVLSTFVCIWQIIEKRKELSGKVKLKMSINVKYPVYHNNTVGEPELLLSIILTNIGQAIIHVARPEFELNKKDAKGKVIFMMNVKDLRNYPIEVGSGKKVEFEYSKKDIKSNFEELALQKSKKFRALVIDTFGKKYRSNWLKINAV
jgi:hypothetical protein